ncbi:hypothetical protein [Streptomyces sp. NPDC005046]
MSGSVRSGSLRRMQKLVKPLLPTEATVEDGDGWEENVPVKML